MRAISTSLFIATLCALVPLAAGAASPDYIDSMAPFEVRTLSGVFAPTNGSSSMASVTPQEWLNSDPSNGGLSGVIAAWNGGGKARGDKMYVHGGGHFDSANNGLYIFNFNGVNAPTGWEQPLVISSVNAVTDGTRTYADGLPTSVHTYDGVVHAWHNQHVYRFIGALYSQTGGFTPAAFKYNDNPSLAGYQTWTQLPDIPAMVTGAVTIYDPVTGKILVVVSSRAQGWFFRTSNDTWSSQVNVPDIGFYSVGAWDTLRDRGIIVGGGIDYLAQVDFAAETVSMSPLNVSGDTSILQESAVGVVYDPVSDVYWLFGGDDQSPAWNTIYSITAGGTTMQATAHQLSGDSIEVLSGAHGSYGRFVLMDSWRAIGIVGTHTAPVSVIKLPGEVTAATIPKAPTGVN